MSLPNFKYHPDPVGNGHVEESENKCLCCDQTRGYVYLGPIYSEDDLDESLCPWCIHEGKAHEKFDAVFVDSEAFTEEIPEAVMEEICERTPGFYGWQQERWLCCCGDAGAFLGCAGKEELEEKYPEAIPLVKEDSGMEGEEWEEYYNALVEIGSPTAYIFQCLHCKKYLAYTDFE